MRIGLLSDTHSFIDPKIFDYLKDCDELWHAGDIGNMAVANQLAEFKPLRAVFGNIDDKDVRVTYPEDLRFNCEGLSVLITHIAGTPPKYNPRVKKLLHHAVPDILICGHSHILQVKKDATLNDMLFINPGAAGNHGFHRIKTIMRFTIEQQEVKNMEAIELGKRGATA